MVLALESVDFIHVAVVPLDTGLCGFVVAINTESAVSRLTDS